LSKVKIQGNASGTGVITLTAPNTNTDRTITLPDGDISLGVGIDDNATSTAITIDSSENVLIGMTAVSGTTDGLHLRSGIASGVNVTNDHCFALNRKSSDGEALRFLKDGALVGSIDVSASGASIKLGGTAAANALDDYEEGTWTPVVTGTGGAPSSSTFHTNPSGKYTKVGRLVTVQFYLHINTLTGGSGTLKLTGVPFTPMAASGGFKGTVSMYYANSSSYSSPVLQINSSGAFLAIEVANGSGGYLSNVSWVNAPLSAFASATAMSGTVTFMAA